MSPVLKLVLGWLLTQEQQQSARVQTFLVGILVKLVASAITFIATMGIVVKVNLWCGGCVDPKVILPTATAAATALAAMVMKWVGESLTALISSIGQRDLGAPAPAAPVVAPAPQAAPVQ